jgi:hypothetical protein
MMLSFLHGIVFAGSAACGLFFLRFWRSTRDRLFLYFAMAFWLLAVERWVLILVHPANELRPYVYVFRLLAFVMIMIAVVEKNTRNRR